MENLNLALTLLLAGFVIVFLVLVLLILIITVYGKIIQFAQKAVSKKNQKVEKPAIRSVTREEIEEYGSDEIPEEIIAVIAAAVDAMYGTKPHRIKNVKRSRSIRSSWGNAGIAENTRPF